LVLRIDRSAFVDGGSEGLLKLVDGVSWGGLKLIVSDEVYDFRVAVMGVYDYYGGAFICFGNYDVVSIQLIFY
jgi:hypothetical protein